VALFGGDGPQDRRKTPLAWNPERPPVMSDLLDTVASCGTEALSGGRPRRVVVAWPGPVTPDGTVLASPTVTGGAKTTDVRGELSRRWSGADVHVVNDLTAAGLHLCAAGLRDFAAITVGSGIGHKVFVDGRPVVGPTGRGGELGHLLVDRSETAPRCDCGRPGHLAAVASGRAIVDAVHRMWAAGSGHPGVGPGDRGVDVAAALRAGETDVVDLVTARARVLGWGLATLHVGVGVETFVLLGGFAVAAGGPFRIAVARGAASACWDLGLNWDQAVTVGGKMDSPGLHGAWLQARELGWS